MELKTIFAALGLVATFVTLLFTSAKFRRDNEKHQRELIELDLKLAKQVKSDNHHRKRILRSAKKRTYNLYLKLEPYYPGWFKAGVTLYIGASLVATLCLFNESVAFALFLYALALVGFEVQRRSLIPNFSKDIPELELDESQ